MDSSIISSSQPSYSSLLSSEPSSSSSSYSTHSSSSSFSSSPIFQSTPPIVPPPPTPHRLDRAGALGRVNFGNPIVKVLGVVAIGLGVAAICTGFGAPLIGAIVVVGGGLIFGGSVESSQRQSATSAMRKDGELNVVTYNKGANKADYSLLCMYNHSDSDQENYLESRIKTANFFRNLIRNNEADVIMLQEVFNDEMLVKTIQQEGFHVLQNERRNRLGERNDDCVILLKASRFEIQKVYPQQIDNEDAPIVIAKDRQTNHICMFVTAHVPGLNLTNPNTMAEQAQIGDGYLFKLMRSMDRIAKTNSVDVQIFGADMNRTPEIWPFPFNLFEAAGFDLHRAYETTEVYPPQDSFIERELDYVHSRMKTPQPSATETLMGARKTPVLIARKTRALMDFAAGEKGTPSENSSDHRPVQVKFSVHQHCPV